MSQNFNGAKYEPGVYLDGAAICKLMRADIKAAISAGDLPGGARNYSVRVHNYSGGRSIDIRAKNLPGMWAPCPATNCNHWACEHGRPYDILTADGQRVEKLLRTIHSAYNYDHGDIMTDYFNVNFYGDAQIERNN